MLIRNAEIDFRTISHLRITNGVVTEIDPDLHAMAGEEIVDAHGRMLLPSLQDHHLHLAALATSLNSALCGPPHVITAENLAQSLLGRASVSAGDGDGWVRGIGYHESVAGHIDRDWIDRVLPTRPVRIQHRSGRLWIFNSCALELLGTGNDAPIERLDGRPTGRAYDADVWLRQRLERKIPSLASASELLASYGVTSVTDASPHNDLAELRHLTEEQARGLLLQDVLVMGGAGLDHAAKAGGLQIGARKVHLREIALPNFESMTKDIVAAHDAGRAVAIHCVTLVELVFALTALAEAGNHRDDRIEHASVAPPDVLPLLAAAGVTVVTQPNFVYERGDDYLINVESSEQPWLYRCQGFLTAGIPLAAGTDAPFGNANPWRAMHAAVNRRTRGGVSLGADEALSPERALALFSTGTQDPGGLPLRITLGSPADLCLLDRPWREAQRDLSAVSVDLTLKAGKVIWRRPIGASAI